MGWRCGSGREEGLAFQYPERITAMASDGWSPWSYMGLRGGCIKGGEKRGKGDRRGEMVRGEPCGIVSRMSSG